MKKFNFGDDVNMGKLFSTDNYIDVTDMLKETQYFNISKLLKDARLQRYVNALNNLKCAELEKPSLFDPHKFDKPFRAKWLDKPTYLISTSRGRGGSSKVHRDLFPRIVAMIDVAYEIKIFGEVK